MRQLKVVIVGDGAVGKTCLLWSFMDGRKPDPDEYEPTVFDNMSKMIEIDGEHVSWVLLFKLWIE